MCGCSGLGVHLAAQVNYKEEDYIVLCHCTIVYLVLIGHQVLINLL